MQVNCPYCQGAMDIARGGQYTCPKCKAIFRVDLPETPASAGSAPAAAPPPAGSAGSMAPSAPGAAGGAAAGPRDPSDWANRLFPGGAQSTPGQAPPPGARCARHPDRDASVVCARCGQFACALCSMPTAQGTLCSACGELHGAGTRIVAWERRKEIGFVPAVVQTVTSLLKDPVSFYRAMPRSGGLETPAGFFIVMGYGTVVPIMALWLIFAAIGLQRLAIPQRDGSMTAAPLGMLATGLCCYAALGPPIGLLFSLLGAAINHAVLAVMGAAKHPYEATARTLLYASGTNAVWLAVTPVTMVLSGIAEHGAPPLAILSGLISLGVGLWMLRILVIGIRETQETSSFMAAAALLGPGLIAVCCIAAALVGVVARVQPGR